jgi:hypothetical protein
MSIQPATNTKPATGKPVVSKGVTVSLNPKTRHTPSPIPPGDEPGADGSARLTRHQLKALVAANPASASGATSAPDTSADTDEDDDTDLESLEGLVGDSDDDGEGGSADSDEEDGVGPVDAQDNLSVFDVENETVIDEAAPDNGVLEIYRPECLQCAALVPHETKTWKKCHFSNGNERCPAQSVKIVIGIPLDQIVQAFIVSEQTGNTDRLARLYKQLSEKPDWQQQQVQQGIKRRREELIKSGMSKATTKAAKAAK